MQQNILTYSICFIMNVKLRCACFEIAIIKRRWR